MTKEQIAELRKLDTLPPGPERRLAVYEAAVNVMPRLLDEREALLEALKRAADGIADEWGESSAQDLRDVIARAES